MPVTTKQFTLDMEGSSQIENITKEISNILFSSDINEGIVTIFIKHTTASVMIIEDEPGLKSDTKKIWERLIPADKKWQHNILNHGEDNGHSHLRGQIQGQSLTVPFLEKELTLGTWQQIVVIDFDTSARKRDIVIKIIGE